MSDLSRAADESRTKTLASMASGCVLGAAIGGSTGAIAGATVGGVPALPAGVIGGLAGCAFGAVGGAAVDLRPSFQNAQRHSTDIRWR